MFFKTAGVAAAGKPRLIALLMSALVLMAGLFLYGERMVISRTGGAFANYAASAGEPYVEVDLSHFRREQVRFWFQEEEQAYYLFLPSFASPEEAVRLVMPGEETASLDGEPLTAAKSHLTLAEGRHTLTLGAKSYPLEVRYASRLPALFLTLSPEREEALLQAPYEEQYGAGLKLVQENGEVQTEAALSSMRVRGNTSADWVKKPYQITFSQAVDFLGMGSAVKWNLLSNWSDKTLLRNKVAYDMAAGAGMAYSPESVFVDLYRNGEYQGVYQLCEKVEIAPSRVNIRNLEEYTLYDEGSGSGPREGTLENGVTYKGYETQLATDDLSGGYLLEIERPSRIWESISSFVTRGGQPVTVKRPQYADVQEVAYVSGFWQEMEDAIFSEDGYHPANGRHYTEYVDMDSLVKKYLLEEIVRNYDASSTSQYFYKPADAESARLFAGPAWDYDMSLGNPVMNPLTNQNYISSVSPYGLFAALPMDDFSIWYQLYRHEDFVERVKELYQENFVEQLKALENGKIREYAAEIENSAIMDGIRWGRNKGEGEEGRRAEYAGGVQGLEDFIRIREHYLSGLWLEGRESKKVYLDGGQADMYISYVETLVGDCLEEPLAPVMEGHTFVRWLNGYTGEPYDFNQPYLGEDLYFVAEYVNNADGSTYIAGE